MMTRRPPAKRGFGHAAGASVLIVVLWVCLGLVSITLLFGHSMLMAYRGADNDLAGRQAEQAIEGAARYVQVLLTNPEKPGLMPDIATYESDAVPVGEAFFWFVGRAADQTTGTTRNFGLVDEASRINLNMRVTEPQVFLELIGKLPGMTAELAAAIMDWRDADEEVTAGGAEAETYMRRNPAYSAKNADFESIEELALVSGADRLILYGEDTNLNGVLDPNEDDGDTSLPADNSDGKLDPGILEYLTVFSRESNKQQDGTTARVNVAQPGEELRTLLTEKLSASRASEIMAQIGTPPPRFTSILAFYLRSGMKPEEFDSISDAITVSTQETLVGLINVNTASETVLACIPGIDANKASDLVGARLTRATSEAGLAWVADILGPEGVAQAGPYLTGRSYQVSADVAAVGRYGRGYRRTRFIIDHSTGTPQIIYRRNLAGLGWALGSDVRETFATTKGVQ